MTSKNLYFKLFRQDFKRRIWCPILIFITYFLFMEVRLLMEMDELIRNPSGHSYDPATFVRIYFFGMDASAMSIAACAAAFLCGISGFAYLHSKVQLDTYHSLPVSRTQLFWSKYISGILQFFLPFVIHTLICAGIAAGRNAFSMETIPYMLSYAGVHLVIFILAYSVAVIAVELTGNIVISILGTGVLFGYSTIIALLVEILFYRFFQTYVTYGKRISGSINEEIWCFSPLSMMLKLFSREDSTTIEEAAELFLYDRAYLWVLAAAAVVYSLTAYFIYLKRASEAAGKTIAFRVAEPVIKTMVVIPVSFFIAVFFAEISFDTRADGWFVFGLIFGFILFCILMEIIFRLDIRGAFMHKKQFLFNAACTALIFIVLRYDVTGYDTYVPSDSQIQSCAVSIQQLMPLYQNIHQLSTYGIHYMSPGEYRMANMEMHGNPSVLGLAQKAAREQLEYQLFDYYEGIEELPEYIEAVDRQENYRYVSFGYKLLNGKTIYRQYIIDIADEETLELLSGIFDDYEYKLGSTPLFNDSWKLAFDVLQCRSNFKKEDIMLTSDMQAKLIETYQKEYTKLTLDTVMNVIPVGTIDFARKTKETGYNVSYSSEMYVYPQFSETIGLLKEYGFDMEEELTAEDVESVRVRKETTAIGTTAYYTREMPAAENQYSGEDRAVSQMEDATEYTDKEQIQKILDSVVSEALLWKTGSFVDFFDRQYTIDVQYKTDESTYSGYYFINGQVPDFIQ